MENLDNATTMRGSPKELIREVLTDMDIGISEARHARAAIALLDRGLVRHERVRQEMDPRAHWALAVRALLAAGESLGWHADDE